MSLLTTIELKAFLPSRDFALSKRFYQQLGFGLEPLGDNLACLSHGAAKFLLQASYVKEFAENLQLHLMVEDVDSWWERANEVIPGFGLSLSGVHTQPWGLRDFTFHDPAGVCWRVAQEMN